ncbi:MAG: hypothetical protein AB7G48_08175 [Nitrospiraceae bacterium]
MNRMSVRSTVLSVAFMFGLAACATEQGSMTGGSAATSSTTSGTAAKGAADSNAELNACLARIPKDSSPGTRMVAEESCRRDEAVRQSVVGTASTKSGDRVSSGTQGDTLDACMARIPKDASAGQRMLAEESCKRDQANRQ